MIYWTRFERTGFPQINMLGSPSRSVNPTAIGVLGAVNLRNDAMMYCANTTSRTLRDARGIKVEANIPLL